MTRQTIHTNFLQTIDWVDGTIVDWVSAGRQYCLDGTQKQLAKNHYPFSLMAQLLLKTGNTLLSINDLEQRGSY